MWCVFAIVGLKRLLKRMRLVAITASVFFTIVAASGLYTDQPGFLWLHVATPRDGTSRSPAWAWACSWSSWCSGRGRRAPPYPSATEAQRIL